MSILGAVAFLLFVIAGVVAYVGAGTEFANPLVWMSAGLAVFVLAGSKLDRSL